jgi:hypothetical protein
MNQPIEKTSQQIAQDFLRLAPTSLPGARFLEEEKTVWRDAWAVVRWIAKNGGTCEELCGTKIVLFAQEPGWHDKIVVA